MCAKPKQSPDPYALGAVDPSVLCILSCRLEEGLFLALDDRVSGRVGRRVYDSAGPAASPEWRQRHLRLLQWHGGIVQR